MSDADSFIEEVTEEVRRDRLFALFRKYGWIAVLAVVLLVGGASWNEWQKARARAAAQAFGDALDAAVQITDPAARAAALADVEAPTRDAEALKSMMQAADLASAGQQAEAVALLQGVADDEGVAPVYRDLARLKLAMLPGGLDAGTRASTLQMLSAPGAPFRTIAMELSALASIEAGEVEQGVTMLRQLLDEPGVSDAQRQRAGNMIVALGFDLQAPAQAPASDG